MIVHQIHRLRASFLAVTTGVTLYGFFGWYGLLAFPVTLYVELLAYKDINDTLQMPLSKRSWKTCLFGFTITTISGLVSFAGGFVMEEVKTSNPIADATKDYNERVIEQSNKINELQQTYTNNVIRWENKQARQIRRLEEEKKEKLIAQTSEWYADKWESGAAKKYTKYPKYKARAKELDKQYDSLIAEEKAKTHPYAEPVVVDNTELFKNNLDNKIAGIELIGAAWKFSIVIADVGLYVLFLMGFIRGMREREVYKPAASFSTNLLEYVEYLYQRAAALALIDANKILHIIKMKKLGFQLNAAEAEREYQAGRSTLNSMTRSVSSVSNSVSSATQTISNPPNQPGGVSVAQETQPVSTGNVQHDTIAGFTPEEIIKLKKRCRRRYELSFIQHKDAPIDPEKRKEHRKKAEKDMEILRSIGYIVSPNKSNKMKLDIYMPK